MGHTQHEAMQHYKYVWKDNLGGHSLARVKIQKGSTSYWPKYSSSGKFIWGGSTSICVHITFCLADQSSLIFSPSRCSWQPAFQIFNISIHSKDICQQNTNLSEIVHSWFLVCQHAINMHAYTSLLVDQSSPIFCPCWWVVVDHLLYRCHEIPHRVHRTASRLARRVLDVSPLRQFFPFTYSTFPAYFAAYSVKTQAPSSGYFNYISVRCARCGISCPKTDWYQ